jgi:hypothetical protein
LALVFHVEGYVVDEDKFSKDVSGVDPKQPMNTLTPESYGGR